MQGKYVRQMCITDKLKEEGFVSTKNLSDWQEQQLQDAVRKGEAVRLKNGIYADIDALANTHGGYTDDSPRWHTMPLVGMVCL